MIWALSRHKSRKLTLAPSLPRHCQYGRRILWPNQPHTLCPLWHLRIQSFLWMVLFGCCHIHSPHRIAFQRSVVELEKCSQIWEWNRYRASRMNQSPVLLLARERLKEAAKGKNFFKKCVICFEVIFRISTKISYTQPVVWLWILYGMWTNLYYWMAVNLGLWTNLSCCMAVNLGLWTNLSCCMAVNVSY